MDETAAAMARFNEAESRTRRIVAGLPPDPPPLQPPTQTPSLPQPAAPTPPHASTVSSVPAGSASARANEPVTPERPSALEPVLPPLSPAQEGPVAEAQGVRGADMPTQPSGAEAVTWDAIEISFLSEERVQISQRCQSRNSYTMPSSASKMPGTGSQIGLGKPCVCSRHNAASSGMLQRLANGRSLRKEYRKYERYSGSTSASRRIRSRLLKTQDTKSFSRLVAALHSTPSDFSPAAI